MKKLFLLSFALITCMANNLVFCQITKQLEETSYTLRDISFIDSQNGWAVGFPHWDQYKKEYVSTILKTSDGAGTWTALNVPGNIMLNKVNFVNENKGWAVGKGGFIFHSSDGGDTWTSQNINTSDEIKSLFFVNSDIGFLSATKPISFDGLGEADNWTSSIWKTTNGGTTWSKQVIPTNAAIINDIEFIDELNGWCAGAKMDFVDEGSESPSHFGVVYFTKDGGQTWSEQSVPKPPANFSDSSIIFTSIDFVNPMKGFVTGFKGNSAVNGSNLYITNDGGENWKQDTNQATIGTFMNLMNVQFVDENYGYIIGTNYIAAWGAPVIRTMDGGVTWETVKMRSHNGEGLYGLAVFSNSVIVVGDFDFQATSTDPWGSGPWSNEDLFTQKYINAHYQFEDIYFSDENNGWATGSFSTAPDSMGQLIMHTSNSGVDWDVQFTSEKTIPAGTPRLNKLHFADSLNGWVVGGAGWDAGQYILRTSDGGKNWEVLDDNIPEPKKELYSCFFLSKNHGWALEAGSYDNTHLGLLRTLDGGDTWERIETEIEGSWGVGFGLVQGDIFFTDSLHGWAGGNSGGLIHTNDGGTTWTKQVYPEYSNCNSIFFTNSSKGWAAGNNEFIVTSDGGEHWTQIESNSYTLQDIQFVSSQSGWASGDRGTILRTKDGGNNWSNLSSITNTYNSLLGLHFIDSTTGWAAGESGTIFKIETIGIKKEQTISSDTEITMTYGDVDFELEATASSGLSVSLESQNEDIAAIVNGKVSIKGAGSTSIVASQSGNEEYYPAESIYINLRVEKKLLIASATNASRSISEENPELLIQYEGFVLGENESELDIQPMATCAATLDSPAGNYEIVLTGGQDNNYEFQLNNGTLTITSLTNLLSQKKDQFKVYPIPAFDKVTVSLPDNKQYYVSIYSLENQLVYSTKVRNKIETINVENLKPGIYILKVQNNNKVLSRKIIVSVCKKT